MYDPLNAGAICTRTVTIAYPDMPLNEAARLMREHHVGCLVVVEPQSPEGRIVVGMLTDRDIVTGVVAADRDLHGLRVNDVMSKDLITAREQDSVLDVLAAMRRKRVRRIPVIGPHGMLIGIIAIDDVLELLAEEMQALASAVGATQRQARTIRP
jgi:CBS domain-containing protein